MSAIVFVKDSIEKASKIFTFGDDKVANAKKGLLNALSIISFVGSFFTERMGVNPYVKPSLWVLAPLCLAASYNIESKNKAADKLATLIYHLAHSKYKWRNQQTLVKKTGMTANVIDEFICAFPEFIIRSQGKSGNVIYRLTGKMKAKYIDAIELG